MDGFDNLRGLLAEEPAEVTAAVEVASKQSVSGSWMFFAT